MPILDPREVTLSLIAAIDRHRLIGVDGVRMPWHLPADLKHFRAVTLGKPVIMGRRTHESIGRPLPGRLNIVLTRGQSLAPQTGLLQTAPDIKTARVIACDWLAHSAIGSTTPPEIMVIGGAEVYAQTIDDADRIYLTEIDAEFEGTEYFPPFRDLKPGWREAARDAHFDAQSGLPHAFVVYERDRPQRATSILGDAP
jgi:dihydrofolate reductase